MMGSIIRRKWYYLALSVLTCMTLLTGCTFVATTLFPAPSKHDIIAYVEESYGEEPKVITIEHSEKKTESGGLISMKTVYTLQLAAEDAVEFQIESFWRWGSYGPSSGKNDYYNHDVLVGREAAAKELAETYDVKLETVDLFNNTGIILSFQDKKQLTVLAELLLKLDQLYSFVYTDDSVDINVKIFVTSEEEGEIADSISFEYFRGAFEETEYSSEQKASAYRLFHKLQNQFTPIMTALSKQWTAYTGYTISEILHLAGT